MGGVFFISRDISCFFSLVGPEIWCRVAFCLALEVAYVFSGVNFRGATVLGKRVVFRALWMRAADNVMLV